LFVFLEKSAPTAKLDLEAGFSLTASFPRATEAADRFPPAANRNA